MSTNTRFPIIIIDDFFPDVDYVLDLAKNAEYMPSDTCAPGEFSKQHINELDPKLAEWICTKIVGLYWDVRFHNVMWRAALDFMRVTPDSDPDCNRGLIHRDNAEPDNGFKHNDLAGIIYLSKCMSEDTGTSIYKPKEVHTYKLGYMPSKDTAAKVKARNADPETQRPVYKEFLDRHNEQFTEVVKIQNSFNRLACYPGNLWHAPTMLGNPGDETRYTLRIFFDNIYDPNLVYPLERMEHGVHPRSGKDPEHRTIKFAAVKDL